MDIGNNIKKLLEKLKYILKVIKDLVYSTIKFF